MGILLDEARLLLQAKNTGVEFGEVLTLGRQQLFFDPREFVPVLRSARVSKEVIERFAGLAQNGAVADPLFEALGSRRIQAMDVSGYEGATIRHDLNQPVNPELHERFDVVIDGGTLEHVFNFPLAIRNAMEVVKVGGSLILLTPANNLFGHGFYQFSPELFFNALSPQNGYEVVRMVAVELSPAHRKYEVMDPSAVKSRVVLRNSWPVQLFVHARRTAVVPIFATTPQQTDYVRLWQSRGEADRNAATQEAGGGMTRLNTSKFAVKRSFKRVASRASWLVQAGALLWNGIANTEVGFRNRKFFRRIE